jgi:hypothetical protein
MPFTSFITGFVRLVVAALVLTAAAITPARAQQLASYEIVSSDGNVYGLMAAGGDFLNGQITALALGSPTHLRGERD